MHPALKCEMCVTCEGGVHATSSSSSSWGVLGTNLSKMTGPEQWDTEPQRLLMMDRRDYGRLGMGIDDLIESFVQAVLANRAIDDLACQLVKRGGGFRRELFASLNSDPVLMAEIREEPARPRESISEGQA